MKTLLVLTLALAALAGCGSGSAPTPTAGGFEDVISELVLRGATVREHVSGDAGCADVSLHSNALRLEVSMDGDAPRSVYLFRWRRPADFDAAADEFAACVSSHTGSVVTLEHAPWRAYGADWSADLEAAVEQALDATTAH